EAQGGHFAVGRERGTEYLPVLQVERVDRLAVRVVGLEVVRLGVPALGALPGDELVPLGRPQQVRDPLVHGQGGDRLAAVQVPDHDFAVVPAGGEPLAVRGEGQGGDVGVVPAGGRVQGERLDP